ncbi:MAG: TIGR04165 family Cys-rich peptide [Methanobrevibacter wolinii]|uniref:TIGR04165 family Cys-rich peptide n=1 Tax=Methanobrevibacter wolinii TaxID=190977 RepID=UPI0005B26E09|nr:TIGR04165 family Cys-rich peptide [Methanobrevibacter wolinii]MDD5959505.1 TIGR04165 family Cys-rich peptide [Methanobrevibacter wolinii]
MKVEDLIAKCPKCGSTDKTVRRKIIDNHLAHAETAYFRCTNCGYVFEKGEDHSNDPKDKIIKELNKIM